MLTLAGHSSDEIHVLEGLGCITNTPCLFEDHGGVVFLTNNDIAYRALTQMWTVFENKSL